MTQPQYTLNTENVKGADQHESRNAEREKTSVNTDFEVFQEAEIDSEFSSFAGSKQLLAAHRPIPRRSSVRSRFNVNELAQEESQRVVQRLFLQSGEAPRAVVFAGIEHGNGCSGICAQSAEILASSVIGPGCRVDANLRAPALPDIFGISNHNGLTDALLSKDPVKTFTKRLHPSNLFLLSCGSLANGYARALGSEP
jgi:hypothetical protein